MQNPWVGMKEQTLTQFTHHAEKAKKARNQMTDAENKIKSGDQSPQTIERYNKAKAEYEAYAPVVDALKQEILT